MAKKPKAPKAQQSILVMREKGGHAVQFQATAYASLNNALRQSAAKTETLVEKRPGLWTALSGHDDYDDKLNYVGPLRLWFVDVFSFAEAAVEPEIAHISVHKW